MGLECIRGASLAPLNTFGIDECAEQLCLVHSDAELREALALADQRGWPVQLLGGGSNLVLAGPVSGLTVVMRSRGRRVVRRNLDSERIAAPTRATYSLRRPPSLRYHTTPHNRILNRTAVQEI